MCHIFKKDRQG